MYVKCFCFLSDMTNTLFLVRREMKMNIQLHDQISGFFFCTRNTYFVSPPFFLASYKLWETLHVELWPRRWITTETLHLNQIAGLHASTGIFFKDKIKHFYWKVLSYELCDSQGLWLALHKNSSARVQKNSAREIWRAFPKNLGALLKNWKCYF